MDSYLRTLVSSTVASFEDQLTKYVEAAIPQEVVIELWASEVGAYCGVDTWLTRDKALGKVWKRCNMNQYLRVQKQWKDNGCTMMCDGGEDGLTSAAKFVDCFPHIKTRADVGEFRKTASPDDLLKLYKTKGIVFEDEVATMVGEDIMQPVVKRHDTVVWTSSTRASRPSFQHRPPGIL